MLSYSTYACVSHDSDSHACCEAAVIRRPCKQRRDKGGESGSAALLEKAEEEEIQQSLFLFSSTSQLSSQEISHPPKVTGVNPSTSRALTIAANRVQHSRCSSILSNLTHTSVCVCWLHIQPFLPNDIWTLKCLCSTFILKIPTLSFDRSRLFFLLQKKQP